VAPNRVEKSSSGSSESTTPSRKRERINPFYVVLLGVGTLFVITCFGFFVMTLNQIDPAQIAASRQSSFIVLMEEHGLNLLIVELVVLAICTFAAIGTDEYWSKSAAKQEGTEADSAVTSTNQLEHPDEAATKTTTETTEE
jgi:hypothetical protein